MWPEFSRYPGTRSAAMKCKDRPKIKSAGNGYSFKLDSHEI